MSKRVTISLLGLVASLVLPVAGAAHAGWDYEIEKKGVGEGEMAGQAPGSYQDKQLRHTLKELNKSDGYWSDDDVLWLDAYRMAVAPSDRQIFAEFRDAERMRQQQAGEMEKRTEPGESPTVEEWEEYSDYQG